MGAGRIFPAMAGHGDLIRNRLGLPINQGDGYGNHITAGRGSRTNLGAGLPTITDGGSCTLDSGTGGRGQYFPHIGPSMLRPMCSLSGLVTSTLALVRSVGCHA